MRKKGQRYRKRQSKKKIAKDNEMRKAKKRTIGMRKRQRERNDKVKEKDKGKEKVKDNYKK